MAKQCIIYGAGGHGRVVLDVVRASGNAAAFFVDDRLAGTEVDGLRVINLEEYVRMKRDDLFIVAIGANSKRAEIYLKMIVTWRAVTLVHPFTFVSPSALIGSGTVLMPGSIVNSRANIAENTIINTSASVDHDCTIGPHSHLCPGVRLAGNVTIGGGTILGTGASVIPGVNIGTNCVIGAGACVIRDIPDGSKAFGVPARIVGLSD